MKPKNKSQIKQPKSSRFHANIDNKTDKTPKKRKRNMLTKLQLVSQTFMNTLTNGMFSLTESCKNMILV